MNVASIDDDPSEVFEHGVVEKSCVVVKRCAGVVAERCVGVVAMRCVGVVAERCVGVVANRCVGVVSERCVVAKRCVVAERGVVTDMGIVAKSGVVTERSVDEVDGVTTKRRFVGVGSTDTTFARLPKEAVKDVLRFLPAWMSADAAVRGNRSGANAD